MRRRFIRALHLSNSQHPLSSIPYPHDLGAVPAVAAAAAAAAAPTCTSGGSRATRRSTWPTSPPALALAKQQWGLMRREFDAFLGGAGLSRFEDLASYGRRTRALERPVTFLDRREAFRAPAEALMYTFALADTPHAHHGGDHAAVAATMPITGRDDAYRACTDSCAARGNLCAGCGATVQLFARGLARHPPGCHPPLFGERVSAARAVPRLVEVTSL